MKVLMVPHLVDAKGRHGGINRVVEGLFSHLPEFGVELVPKTASDYDILVSHAGAASGMEYWPTVVHCAGLYWANDYPVTKSMLAINATVIGEVRHARAVTVPSRWVAKSFQRDMRFSPHVVPHGIDWQSWQHSEESEGYVLWNKNRPGDACDPGAMIGLAATFPEIPFVTTFTSEHATPNVYKIDVMPHDEMRRIVQRAGFYLSIARETFGIGTLEAMASGVPVLGWDFGGNRDIVEHGVTGYLAEPENYEDLAAGLDYCRKYRDTLGDNARAAARRWTWGKVAEQVAGIYRGALKDEEPTVSIVIPCFNYAGKVGRAIESALSQDYPLFTSIIVVDDGSEDEEAVRDAVTQYTGDGRVVLIRQPNSGVAVARNRGIAESRTKYVCTLDADDAIEPDFISTLVPALESDRGLGIAYSKLTIVTYDKRTKVGTWPDEFDYDAQVEGRNQVPTCCLFRREMWERLGGYKQRYSPIGCGAEDAEFWLRAGAIGYNAKLATTKPLFTYSLGTGYTTGNPDYKEVNWLAWHPWTADKLHPFASVATPRQHSHPARQYDSPVVSVIIPVGDGHQHTIIEALDSLEAQTFREWEVIVVDDTTEGDCPNCDEYWVKTIQRSYPYVTFYSTMGRMGAGHARNRGAELARAPLLLFLDADDFLKPTCIEEMLNAYAEGPAIIYSDYEAHAEGVDQESADKRRAQNRLLHYDETGYAVWNGQALAYNWERAQIQPEDPPYIWNLISSLVPKQWHEEVGGFDEEAPSWEDWDYWVRLAFLGKPFVRVPLPLVVYLYWTGGRREIGYKLGSELLQYYQAKYKELDKMPCTSCGGRRPTYNPRNDPRRAPGSTISQAARQVDSATVPDRDWIKCRYINPNTGWHNVVGAYIFEQQPVPHGIERGITSMRSEGGYRIVYGYRSSQDVFLVHVRDMELMPRDFDPIERRVPSAPRAIEMPEKRHETLPPPPTPKRTDIEQLMDDIEPKRTPPPKRVEEPVEGELDLVDDPEYLARMEREKQRQEPPKPPPSDLNKLPLSQQVIDRLHEMGYTMIEQLSDWTVEQWQEIHGVGPVKAEAIAEMVKRYTS